MEIADRRIVELHTPVRPLLRQKLRGRVGKWHQRLGLPRGLLISWWRWLGGLRYLPKSLGKKERCSTRHDPMTIGPMCWCFRHSSWKSASDRESGDRASEGAQHEHCRRSCSPSSHHGCCASCVSRAEVVWQLSQDMMEGWASGVAMSAAWVRLSDKTARDCCIMIWICDAAGCNKQQSYDILPIMSKATGVGTHTCSLRDRGDIHQPWWTANL